MRVSSPFTHASPRLNSVSKKQSLIPDLEGRSGIFYSVFPALLLNPFSNGFNTFKTTNLFVG